MIMPSTCLIVALIGGLALTFLMKLMFNKISGKNGVDFANMGEFLKMFIVCFIIVLAIMISITAESAMKSH